MYWLIDNQGRLASSRKTTEHKGRTVKQVFVYTTLHTAQIAKRLLDERDENFYKIEEV